MFQNYELLFVIGTLGAIISLILLLIALIKNANILKIISLILIPIFIVTFSAGIALGYYYYENSKNINNEVNEKNLVPKITSGSSEDPIVITEKTFFVDDNYYYSEFEIKNNNNIEISKISFHTLFTYKGTLGDGIHDEHIFLLDSVIPPNKTVVKDYIWKKDTAEQQLSINNVKLTKIQNIVCYVNINGEEKSMKLDDLKSMLNNKK